jgi:hypothetical protein
MLATLKPMLARLENAISRYDLVRQMVLLPGAKPVARLRAADTINLIVAYNGSPNSHAALDLTLLMAHQTRLATGKQVEVQVVYVIDKNDPLSSSLDSIPLKFSSATSSKYVTSVLTQPQTHAIATLELERSRADLCPTNSFEKAEYILWQARYLVEEWRDTFTAHLRFGCTATELKKVVELESAALLFLGCNRLHHPLVEKLGAKFPVPVLGVPTFTDN